jgi:hypothetical protein
MGRTGRLGEHYISSDPCWTRSVVGLKDNLRPVHPVVTKGQEHYLTP